MPKERQRGANGRFEKSAESRVASFLEEARETAQRAYEAEFRNRERSRKSLKFLAGEQWKEETRQQREDVEKLPCLTINITKKFKNQVTNEIRQMRPSIRVSPVDDYGDVETAKVIQGLIRHVERNSKAEVAYDMAADRAAGGGYGYFRFVTRHTNNRTFDQDIFVAPILNPDTVYGDPDSSNLVGMDWNRCFIVEDFSEQEFKKRWSWADPSGFDTLPAFWQVGNKIRTAEYFYIERQAGMLYELSEQTEEGETNIVVDAARRKLIEDMAEQAGLPKPQVVQQRETEFRRVKWCRISGTQILEGNKDRTAGRDFPGSWIPLVRVFGDCDLVDGELVLRGVTHDAEDSQRMVNFLASYMAQTIALAPKNPRMVAAEAIEGFEKEWDEANRVMKSYLRFHHKDDQGQALPAPSHDAYEPPIQAVAHAFLIFSEQVKSTIGLYGPSIGEPSGEKSGIAIRERKQQGNMATFHFGDNLGYSMWFAGKQLVGDGPDYPGLLQAIYDRPGRVARILGEENDERMVTLDPRLRQPHMKRPGKDGKIEEIYNPWLGNHDVAVYMGPSFAAKRQEAVESMTQLAAADKRVMEVAGDLVVKNMDWPGAQEIAERLKKLIPPEILEGEGEGGQQQVPPQAKAQMRQMAQQLNQLSEALDEAMKAIDQKQVETQSKERIEREKLTVEMQIEQMKMLVELVKTYATLQDKQEALAVRGQIDQALAKMDFGRKPATERTQ